MKEYIDKYIIGEEYEAIRMQLEELLRRKVKNCKNSTIIFDTKDYVLLDDIIDAVSKILSQYVSDTTFADAYRALVHYHRWRKTSEEPPSSLFKERGVLDEFLNPSEDNQVLCLTRSKRYGIKLLAYNKYYNIWDNEDLDDYFCEIEEIEEWKPIK